MAILPRVKREIPVTTWLPDGRGKTGHGVGWRDSWPMHFQVWKQYRKHLKELEYIHYEAIFPPTFV
ncbi:hypothetical protein BJV78DRAFT_1254232 [Lactifluus subvellereus]|nr:hypothetical protein BJV78DRAFT_1254232 [Lactifluus subvellereus]